MSNWPLLNQSGGYTIGMSGTYGTDVTPGVSGAKGSWVELSSSLPTDADGLVLSPGHWNTSMVRSFDIGVGASGSEVAIVRDILNPVTNSQASVRIPIPVAIPRGTRVSIRAAQQTDATARIVTVSCNVIPPSGLTPKCRGSIITLNCDDETKSGTFYATNYCDGGGTPSTKGAWTELTSSCPRDTTLALIALVTHPSSGSYSVYKSVDLGVGGSGSEAAVLSDVTIRAADRVEPGVAPALVPVAFKRGDRISARVAAATANTYGRLCGVILYLC